MSKRRKPATPSHDELLAAPAHTHGPHCTHCGTAMQRSVEVSYEINDRMLQMLVLALAKQQGLRAAYAGSGMATKVVVEGPDEAALAKLGARVHELCAKLDEQLLRVTRDFVRAHTGLELAHPKRE